MNRFRWIVGGFLVCAALCLMLAACSKDEAAENGKQMPAPVFSAFLSAYLSNSGRIVDTGNDDISHSEGQGYGMLFAVEADDRASFDHMAKWTQKNLAIREDGLLAWKWVPDGEFSGQVTDRNNATDGDILIAWAYLRAYDNWNREADRESALVIMDAILANGLIETTYGPAILPGTEGFRKSDGAILNLSYWVFPALERFALAQPNESWGAVRDSGWSLLSVAGLGAFDLPPDWIYVDGVGNVSPAEDWPVEFGYNAIRIPAHLCGMSSAGDFERLNVFRDYFSKRGNDLSTQWSLSVDQPTGYSAGGGFQAVAELVLGDCQLETIRQASTVYYEDALIALAHLMSCKGDCRKH